MSFHRHRFSSIYFIKRYFVSFEKCNVCLIAAKLEQVKIARHFSSRASPLIVTSNSSLQSQNIVPIQKYRNVNFSERKKPHFSHSTNEMIHDLFLNTWRRLKDGINHVCGYEKSFFLLETDMILFLGEYFAKFIDLSVEKYLSIALSRCFIDLFSFMELLHFLHGYSWNN